MDTPIDEERAEVIYQEMLTDALRTRRFTGITLLQFKIKLREAVWEGARQWEEKNKKRRRS